MIFFIITSLSINLLYGGGDILPLSVDREEIIPSESDIGLSEKKPFTLPASAKKSTTLISHPKKNIHPLGLYIAAGVTAARYDPNCTCLMKGSVDKTAGLIGRIGYDFNQYFGVEARGVKTKWSSEGGDLEHYGAFLKPMYPLSNAVNIYGVAGYAKTKTPGVTRRKVDTEALAWGLGLEYDLGADTPKEGRYAREFDGYGDQERGWGLFVDYERLVQKSGSPDFDTINVGITYDF